MEMVMSNGFAELSVTEMSEIDGGKLHWYDPLSVNLGWGILLFMLGYRNGYDSTR